MDFDLCNSGGEGGKFIAPWESLVEFHKHHVGFICGSFRYFCYGGGEGGLVLLVQDALLMLHYQLAPMLLEQVCSGIGLHFVLPVWFLV